MTIIYLLISNAIAHIISFVKLNRRDAMYSVSTNAMGVLLFVFINAIIAFLLWQGFAWAKWLAFAFPLIGGLGLLFTTILKKKGTWIDYIILMLDIFIVSLVLMNLK